jgi:hypothetical protein
MDAKTIRQKAFAMPFANPVFPPNTPILAGQVPEPSTGALIILAGGVMLLKRNRKRLIRRTRHQCGV